MRLMMMTVLLASTALLGCDGKSSEQTTSTTETFIDIPDSTFLAQRPAEAKDLAVVKKDAKIGDQVTFLARVGGRARPFVEKQAIFIAADPSLQSCEVITDDDHCSIPWDYCCEDGELLREGMATIRILNTDGRPFGVNAKGAGGLQASKFIVVEGTVSELNDEGLFVVDASHIWVGGKPTFKEPRKGSM